MLALDLGVLNRGQKELSAKGAFGWTCVWVTLALCFGAWMWWWRGARTGLEWLTGWLIEYSLSVDNLFVFILIFKAFRVPPAYQHRILFWGILGALVLRMVIILAGAALVHRFHWILYGFGAFLLYSGVKILASKEDQGEEHPEQNKLVRFATRLFPATHTLQGSAFLVIENGRRAATPLFICLVTVELSDVVFAVDSIPAIFAITEDPFVVFTSNIFAILGLRSLYFLLARWVNLFRFLKTGLGIVLSFVGAKMLAGMWDVKVPASVSLGIIVLVLAVSIIASLLIPKKPAHQPLDPSQPVPPLDAENRSA
jgi:tellurite resistance protein TerC